MFNYFSCFLFLQSTVFLPVLSPCAGCDLLCSSILFISVMLSLCDVISRLLNLLSVDSDSLSCFLSAVPGLDLYPCVLVFLSLIVLCDVVDGVRTLVGACVLFPIAVTDQLRHRHSGSKWRFFDLMNIRHVFYTRFKPI